VIMDKKEKKESKGNRDYLDAKRLMKSATGSRSMSIETVRGSRLHCISPLGGEGDYARRLCCTPFLAPMWREISERNGDPFQLELELTRKKIGRRKRFTRNKQGIRG